MWNWDWDATRVGRGDEVQPSPRAPGFGLLWGFMAGESVTVSIDLRSYARTLLVLGRISNLPTVWSNCLAGWWLGGGSSWSVLIQLCIGASLLYVGGMFLNDAFDAEFDRQHRFDRPIPSGAISLAAVWRWGLLWMGLGAAFLVPRGTVPAILTLCLTGAILLYDAVHKRVVFSPVLMALCRFLLILLASAFGQLGVGGLSIWTGLALGGYIVGLSYLAKRESRGGVLSLWPLLPMAAPLVLAWVVNAGPMREASLLLSLVLLLWVIKSIAPMWQSATPNIGLAVSRLLAGICLVDLLAVADVPRELAGVFVLFLGLSLLLQRRIPAT